MHHTHGDSPYGYGDWCFCFPLSHGCAGVPLKILAKKPKYPALPLRHIELGSYHSHTGIEKPLITVPIWGLPYGNGDSQIPISEWVPYEKWNNINPRSNTGITRDYRMVTGIHKSLYGNGVSPIPYGDCKDINPCMETGITRDYHIEMRTGTSLYGNGTWPLPYGDQKQTDPRINMGITTP